MTRTNNKHQSNSDSYWFEWLKTISIERTFNSKQVHSTMNPNLCLWLVNTIFIINQQFPIKLKTHPSHSPTFISKIKNSKLIPIYRKYESVEKPSSYFQNIHSQITDIKIFTFQFDFSKMKQPYHNRSIFLRSYICEISNPKTNLDYQWIRLSIFLLTINLEIVENSSFDFQNNIEFQKHFLWSANDPSIMTQHFPKLLKILKII